MRHSIGSCLVACAALALAGDAAAQSHYLLARTNGSFNGESTSDPNDDHVEHLLQEGVGGVNPSYYAIFASTDSASGAMAITGSWSLAGGAADPIQPPSTFHSATRIAQDLDPGTPTGDSVTVRATLTWNGSASMESLVGVERTDLSAQLRLGECQAFFRREVYSNGLVEDNPIDCSEAVATGTASANAIQVTMVYPSAAIDSFTTFHIDAQLAADIDNAVDFGDSGEYAVSGAVSVEVEGLGSYAYVSPTFLTLPEPGASLEATTASLGIAACVLRARRAADRGQA